MKAGIALPMLVALSVISTSAGAAETTNTVYAIPTSLGVVKTTDTLPIDAFNTTAAYSLLPLGEFDTVSGAPLRQPSLASDLDTTITAGPDIEMPAIYWGTVGGKGGYSLQSVMATAWKANPNWATFSANHATAHAALVEASAFPNPELDLEFGSESADSGGNRSIWSLGFSQPIELPGKRAARQAEALAGYPVVTGEQYEYANTLKADVRAAYWTTQYHAALEQMFITQVTLTQQQFEMTETRVELGDAGRIELSNARVELLKSRRDREASKRRKEGAMSALNALAGGQLGTNFRLSDDFSHSYKRPALQAGIQQSFSGHPRLGRLAAELRQKYAGIERQSREGWPDIKVGARKSKEFDGDSMAVTAGIEIPLFNRNQGGIARAQADAQKIYAQIGIAYNELRRDVEVAYQNLMLGRDQIASYDDGLKDAAQEAVKLAWVQFNLGGGGYIDIFIARRQLIETQQGYIQALYDAATARARYDQAVGN